MTNSNKLPRFKFENYVPSDKRTGRTPFWQQLVNHSWFKGVLGMLGGALVGLLYWKFVGCQSGTCPLTSNPYKSVIIFSLMGLLMAKERSARRTQV